MRPKTNARWEPIKRPDEVARRLYEQFPQAVDLRFSLYYPEAGPDLLHAGGAFRKEKLSVTS